jgi:hypothetical protein
VGIGGAIFGDLLRRKPDIGIVYCLHEWNTQVRRRARAKKGIVCVDEVDAFLPKQVAVGAFASSTFSVQAQHAQAALPSFGCSRSRSTQHEECRFEALRIKRRGDIQHHVFETALEEIFDLQQHASSSAGRQICARQLAPGVRFRDCLIGEQVVIGVSQSQIDQRRPRCSAKRRAREQAQPRQRRFVVREANVRQRLYFDRDVVRVRLWPGEPGRDAEVRRARVVGQTGQSISADENQGFAAVVRRRLAAQTLQLAARRGQSAQPRCRCFINEDGPPLAVVAGAAGFVGHQTRGL